MQVLEGASLVDGPLIVGFSFILHREIDFSDTIANISEKEITLTCNTSNVLQAKIPLTKDDWLIRLRSRLREMPVKELTLIQLGTKDGVKNAWSVEISPIGLEF